MLSNHQRVNHTPFIIFISHVDIHSSNKYFSEGPVLDAEDILVSKTQKYLPSQGKIIRKVNKLYQMYKNITS